MPVSFFLSQHNSSLAAVRCLSVADWSMLGRGLVSAAGRKWLRDPWPAAAS